MRVVKSARRVLDILEYFASVRRPATVSEIERELDLPQSSASVLLRSLVALGYLEYIRADRTFRPTLRVTKLGDWLHHGLSGPLTLELESLRDALNETIILGRRQGARVEFIYLLVPDRTVQFFARRNSLQPMTLSVVGQILLSQLPEAEARAIIRRNNAEIGDMRLTVDESAMIDALARIRKSGIAESDPAFGGERDFHVFARLLPRGADNEPLALGVAGPRDRMLRNRESVIGALNEWVERAKGREEETGIQ